MEMRIGARNKVGYLTGDTARPEPGDPNALELNRLHARYYNPFPIQVSGYRFCELKQLIQIFEDFFY